MTKENFLTYQKFINKDAAIELAEILKSNNINYLIEDHSAPFEPTFVNNELTKEYRIKILQKDFSKADSLLLKISMTEIENVDEDHYLFEFSDEELMEILSKSDEWSKFDYLLAQKILKHRGHEVNDKLLQSLRKQRIEELAKPGDNQNAWIIVGYISALLGGLLGIFIGWHLLSHKKTLPNGERVYGYSVGDRKHGKRILILGFVFLFIWIFTRIWMNS